MDKRLIYMDYRFSNYVMSFSRMIMVGCAKIVIIIKFADCMFMLISVVLVLFLVIKAKCIVGSIVRVIILVHLRSMMLIMIIWISVHHVYIVNMYHWLHVVNTMVVYLVMAMIEVMVL